METTVDFKRIKAQLPHGAQTKIAKAANVALSTVTLVLNGKSENTDVLNAIADYLTDLKAQKQAVSERLSSLLN